MSALRNRDSIGSATGASAAPGTSVQVAVRIRPVTNADQSSIPTRWQRNVIQPISTNTLQVEQGGPPPPGGGGPSANTASSKDKRQAFTFDRVLAPGDGQPEVYSAAEPLVARFLEGYNVTILAYGQTSSGKSYTMGTSALDIDYESLVAGRAPDAQMGIIPRAVAQIFAQIRQNQSRSGAIQYSAKASFIEIYNEDLIDLLADGDGDARPHVQIREDKSGQIIWSGLREVKVQNVADVMNYLLQGSSIRRTNETDMNAQSSRSHAIFSLTLIQRKYVGSGPPPPPSAANSYAPSAYGGRTTPGLGGSRHSGLPRPSSGIPTPGGMDRNRVASPTSGSRPNTPGLHASSIPGPSGRNSATGLRPSSMMVGASRSASPLFGGSGDDGGPRGGAAHGDGEWVTVTSKFHFVDLAGSERLKRTAAQGERIKEGISINSGLHALGNVISALGDTAKAKRTTHIPYRDSKLTRLLQDSLGGNAHTLMIACVSPTEYNLSETVNTLQYANRARNIKNKAELNEIEVGWDDIEYLQSQVVKLRKELGILKEAKGNGNADALRTITEGNPVRSKHKDVLELQDKYAELSQKHSQLTAELTKLQQQHLPRSQSQEKNNADFLEAAEPIIVEYEKAVDVLESQINLMKAALAHSEDVIAEQENKLAEQDAKLASAEHQLEARDATMTSLQARLTRLHDRESSADSYARELEARLQTYTSRDTSNSETLAELRKEVARHKEAESTTEQYIKDLENRLAKSDDNVASLEAQIERLEKDIARREDAYKDLQSRFELLDTGKENKDLLEELDARERRVMELERRVDEVAGEKDGIAREKSRLSDAAAKDEAERKRLEDRIHALEAAAAAAAATAAATAATAISAKAPASNSAPHINGFTQKQDGVEAPHDVETREVSVPAATDGSSALAAEAATLREEVQALRDSEARTRAELETMNVKYRESLREIEDLNGQVSEAKLTQSDDGPSPSTPQLGGDPDEEIEVLAPASASLSRRNSYNPSRGPMRRPESIRIDKSPARRSSGTFLGYNTSDKPGTPSHPRSRSMSQSLSQELSSVRSSGPRPLSLSGSVPPSPILRAYEPSSPASYERQIASLEKETMRLQEVLKEREEEIDALEKSLKANGTVPAIAPVQPPREAAIESIDPADSLPSPGALAAVNNNRNSAPLTPVTEKEFFAIKQLIAETRDEHDAGNEEHLTRLDDLMRSMARKETAHRDKVEQLTEEITLLRKQHETLQTLSRDQVANMSAELEGLRAQLRDVDATPKTSEADTKMSAADNQRLNSELEALRAEVEKSKSDSLQREEVFRAQLQAAKEEHANALSARGVEQETLLASMSRGHTETLTRKTFEHQSTLERKAAEHEQAVAHLAEEHERALRMKDEEYSAALRSAELARQSSAAESEGEKDVLLTQLQEEHQSQIRRLQEEHEVTVSRALAAQSATHTSALSERDAGQESREAEHASAIGDLQRSHESAIAKLASEHSTALAEALAAAQIAHSRAEEDSDSRMQAEHLSALQTAVREVQDKSAQEQQQALEAARAEHAASQEQIKSNYEARLASLHTQHADTLAAAQNELAETKAAHARELEAIRAEHGTDAQSVRNEIEQLKAQHEEELDNLRFQHSDSYETAQRQLEDLKAEHEGNLRQLQNAHGATIVNLETNLKQAFSDRDAAHAAHADLEARHRLVTSQLQVDPVEMDSLRAELAETSDALVTLEGALTETQQERDKLTAEIRTLRDEVKRMRNGQDPDQSLEKELASHRGSLAQIRTELAKSKGEMESLVEERMRQDQLLRDLQQKLAAAESRALSVRNSGSIGSPTTEGFPNGDHMLNGSRSPFRRPSDADQSDHRHSRPSLTSSNSGHGKPPPPTPPPNMPPPPTPGVASGAITPTARTVSGNRTSASSAMTRSESPTGLTRSSSTTSMTTASPSINGFATHDPKAAKLLADQAEELKNLAKQLNHCEADLQANIDLVATLEAALNDSERNLRKSRVQLGEVTRERDRYATQSDELRTQLQSAQKEVESVRNSVLLEKQDYESKIQEERLAKEKARQALEARLEEVSRKKGSKFACF